jgi:Concanavalin A-like lectin/glucanases superfamily
MHVRHITAVLDPMESDEPRISDVRLYVDGQRQNLYDLAEGDVIVGYGEEVRIGALFEPENPHGFGGVLDEMCIFDIALGAEDIARIYAETTI